MLTLGAIGSRYGAVRTLYLIAGVMFILGAVLKFPRGGKDTTDKPAS